MVTAHRTQNVTSSNIVLNALDLLRTATAEHESAEPTSDFESFLQSIKKLGGNRKITHVGCDVYFHATSNRSLAVAVMDQRVWGPNFCPVYRVTVKGDNLEVTSVNDLGTSVLMPMPSLGVMHSKLATVAVKLGTAEFDKSGIQPLPSVKLGFRPYTRHSGYVPKVRDEARQEALEKHPPTEYGSGLRSPLDAARTGRVMHFAIDNGRPVVNHRVVRHAAHASTERI